MAKYIHHKDDDQTDCNCAHKFKKHRYAGIWTGSGPDKRLWLPLETVDSLTTRIVRVTARVVPEHKNKYLSDVLNHTLYAGYKVTLCCLSKTLSGDTSFESLHTVLLVDNGDTLYDICLPDQEFLHLESCLTDKFILAEADLLFLSIEQFSDILTRRLGRHDSSSRRRS